MSYCNNSDKHVLKLILLLGLEEHEMQTYLYKLMVDLVGRKVAKQSHCCPQKYSLTPSNKLQRKSLIVHMDRVEVIRYFIEFNLYFVLVNLIVT